MGRSETRRNVLDTAVNVAVLAAAITVVAVHVAPFLRASNTVTKRPYSIGDVIQQTDDLRFGRPTFLLITRSACEYCTQSMNLYRNIQRQGGRVLAVTQESVETNRAYLEAHGVFPERVLPLLGTGLRAVPTPTLLLVDSGGMVRGAWWGKQDESGQREILGRIK